MVANPKPRKATATGTATATPAVSPPASARGGRPLHTFGDIGPVLVHDFKGPLSAIALNLDFVLEQLPQDASFDAIRAALGECRQAEERIFRVIANLLDVARCEEGRLSLRMQSVAFAELFTVVAAEHEDELTARGIELRVLLPDGLPDFDTDVDLLARVFHNLVDNALRSTKNGGTIVVSVTAEQAERAELDIRISNDGAPIPPSIRPHLFERNLGSEHQGAGANRGVGLYFCRLALQELDATIGLLESDELPVCFQIRHPVHVGSMVFTTSDYPKSSAVPI